MTTIPIGETEDNADILELSYLTKNINSENDILKWNDSPAYNAIYSVLNMLNESVKSKPRSSERTVRPIIKNILGAFAKVHKILDEVEPLKQPMRFGNRAFRTFLTRVYEEREEILKDVTDNKDCMEYFCQSFGSWTRIDYGTGHEFNFLSFISALAVLGIVVPEDCPALVFDVFWGYWDLTLAVQERYHQEPAGSHGAWGVDDYVALPFVFGSSQLIDHSEVVPSNVIDPLIAKAHKDEYIYCRWIDYIYKVKKGNFAEHSRMLYSLRNLPHFTKLNGGMIKMYRGEVMDRFLVVQHFRFGSVLKWEETEEAKA
ncbi:phosphotyrosyl phosphatase activator [Tritrichomonas foetus]|uniref:Serine/threonine-protein phosphatase 2A activator n=1 Tax=Tritrichomonas foetus TaxID=1144522 RepID=A0A1J4J9E7_9EUKA|nr:phosphotyrosyl phosphatase activator [Tritrichomonas foetus]|eukprot:OHS93852.1 phosphotyrosyl phosphatase activator [Tritrichomonas foetus]